VLLCVPVSFSIDDALPPDHVMFPELYVLSVENVMFI
jgi:hypothetical protein